MSDSHAPNRCPKCSSELKVQRTLENGWVIVRYKKCEACQENYITDEKFRTAGKLLTLPS